MKGLGPVSPFVMVRTPGFRGTFFQNITPGLMLRTAHRNAAGARAIRGEVSDGAGPVTIHFSAAVSHSCLTGVEITLDGVPVTGLSVVKVTDTQWEYSFTEEVIAGDVVVWSYAGGNDCILDLNAEDIGPQSVNVVNTVVLAGEFVLLESGGRDTMLTEDDLDIALEDSVV